MCGHRAPLWYLAVMAGILIRGGRVIDPANGLDSVLDLAIDGDRVAAVGDRLDRAGAGRVIDAEGLIVAPGLIDPHVHLREPGQPERETIETGTAAAVGGGFTSVVCMPNTAPAIDSPELIEWIAAKSAAAGACRVFAVGAVSAGRGGERLAEIYLMARAGAVGFSDDGDAVADAGLMLAALVAIAPTGLPMMQHCQEPTLTRGASMNAGPLATRLGLTGWPAVAEEIIIERDIRLNRGVGCRYHVQHVSSGGSVEILREARRDPGAARLVTAEASPHHLILTDRACDGFDTNAKMNPPLRSERDIEALRAGVAEGVITVLGTDHAPHTAASKQADFAAASFGITGLETALPLYAEALVASGAIEWPRLIELMTINPARLCGLDARGLGSLAVGGPGDVTLIDPDCEWTFLAAESASKGRNTPFDGRGMRGRAVATIVGGVLMCDRLGERSARV